VPSLPDHPSGAAEALALHDGRQRSADADVARRTDGAQTGHRHDEPRREAASSHAPGTRRRTAATRLLLRGPPESAAQPPPGLRDVAHPLAPELRSHGDLVRMALPRARVREPRLR